MNYIAWMWKNSHGIRINASVRIVLGTAQVLLGLAMVWLSKRFIDETIHTGSNNDIIKIVAVLILIVLSRIALRQIIYYMATLAVTRKGNALRLDIFSKLFAKQLFSEKEMHSGDVSSRLSKDIETVANVIADTLPAMIVTGIQLLGAFMLMRFFDAYLAWALIIFTPFAILLGKFIAHRLKNMTLDIREKESDIQMHVQEGIEFNAVLRSLGSERHMTGKLDTMQQELQCNIRRRTRFSVITRLLLGSAFGLGYLMAFVWGGIGLRNGVITFGVMTSFLQLVGQIQQPILSLLNMSPQIIHSTASIERLEEMRTGNDAGEAGDSAHGRFAGIAGIKFSEVSFRYAKGDREIVSCFSHDFRPRTKTAILGETGVGKTTLFRLMLGFIAPSAGKIEFYETPDTKPILASESTRANLVFVPQGNTLMSGSIRENLLLAKPDATEEELNAVLHTACADFVKELPSGIDTELSERGGGLSEGQAQRIAIARGLLRPGSVLLLDEISSSLDEETERELYRRLFDAHPEKTMIFITHRSAVKELCDESLKI